ncbi:MAG: presqualene diphosphate synthase HpnD [Alphaproteobacteria bacterium]
MNDAAHTGTPAPSDAEARAYVHAIVARSGTSFLWGMRVLPAPRREAMYAIYAFCRVVDDIADEPDRIENKLARLDHWRAEIDRLYDGHPTEIISHALQGPISDYALPREEFLAIIDGMEMDARDIIRAPSPEDYTLYCRRVAGAVGRLSVRAFGDTSPAAEELAVVLGEALQTTNILRDVVEDAARGRLYLPSDVLDAHGIGARTAEAVLDHPALPLVCADMAARAKERFRQARTLLARCERRRMRPAALMLAIYERILMRLEARGWNRLDEPVRLPRMEKLWVVFRHSLF